MVCSQALSSAVRSIRGHHAPIRALRRRIHTVGGERNRLGHRIRWRSCGRHVRRCPQQSSTSRCEEMRGCVWIRRK